MERALGRLQAALSTIGAPALQRAPVDREGDLERLAAAVAPWSLPRQVRHFWRRLDGYSTTFTTFPHPSATDPDFALDCWTEHREQPGMTPNLLLPVGYEAHAFLLVELDGAHGPGGACFTWAYGLSPFLLVATDLASYLDVAAAVIEERGGDRALEADGRPPPFDDTAFEAALGARLREAPHPVYGCEAEIGCNAAEWPARWLESVGPAARERDARGATTTLGALASDRQRAVTGRVHAWVEELWGLADGCRVAIGDGTGSLRVWCPAAVTMFGPAYDGRRYEFELVTTADGPHGTEAEAIAVRLVDTDLP